MPSWLSGLATARFGKVTPESDAEFDLRFKLEAAAGLNFVTARRFDFAAAARVAATFVVVEQPVKQTAPLGVRTTAGGNRFAAASRLSNRTTTVDRGHFVAARRFHGTAAAHVAAALAVVEQSVEQAAAGSRLAARIDGFAAASGLDGATAVAAGSVMEQAESGVSRIASEQEQGQKGGGDHTTHR